MRILQITPGTGSFYCGSCIRDNALVLALRRLGHDVLMAPMYLPFLVDEMDTSMPDRIFFGGVNVYLQQKIPLFRFTPRWVDVLFNAKSLLRFSAKKAGMTQASDLGEMTVSMLRGENGHQRKEVEKLVEWIGEQMPYDVISLSNCMLMSIAEPLRRELNVPVVCTLQGEDTFMDSLPEPHRSDAWRLLCRNVKHVDAFVPVSYYHGELMQRRMEIPPEKVRVVQNGIALEGYEFTESKPKPRTIGYFARLCSVKGLGDLVQAFIRLKQLPGYEDVQLKVAGTMTGGDEAFVEEQKRHLQQAGLQDAVEFYPNISREDKIGFLRSLSVLSVPATYGESFGLYVIEAMAAGTPVVQPRHAGFVEILERTGGGLLYRHDDPDDYRRALRQMLDDDEKAREMGLKGREEVFRHFNVNRMAQEIAQVFQSVTQKKNQTIEHEASHGIGV